ncbi:hypothetical protein D9V86_08185 [Bacteroidetes/Chlorobi group bacterium ChocPot_Mid]|nr:MAG: hypothetical protein D9V86_08185 [Bacteroidetes/Chlorobi group bacterium ChocPot_Mid]
MDNEISNAEFIPPEEQEELSFSDKLIGIITSPSRTMGQVAKATPNISNWLTPLIIFIVISGIATYLYGTNSALKAEMEEKSMQAIEKSFQDRIDKGEITQEQADEQKEKIMEQMNIGTGSKLVFQFIGISIYTFIAFFFINLIYFSFIKFLIKGEGTYSHVLNAYGLSYYILILQTIITIILSLAFNKFYMGLSLVNFFDVEMLSFSGFLLRKADPLLIWFYAVLGISYAKMFKSDDVKKYIILSFAVWILGNLLLYYLSTVSQVFSGFAM